MSILKNPYFLLPALLFWVNQYLERIQAIFIPYLYSYFDDLMAMPVVLGTTLQIYRWIHPLKNGFVFTPVQVMVGLVYFSILFEGLLPIWSSTYTRDFWDVGCYLIGTVYFYFLINRNRA
ncbi:magnesium citrate secondary transporter [Cyclobacterium plantarum]|uniref:Magnesium citrate secondary transporter n=1 Tax=Cyclobacterium plantarum TaxID=2716263 RepID=A0ABX0H9T9_9BACT|nr:magnesium citrate secondary transporter [Cyclobacterium plantarum]NHE56962.1 magnesium citrate secondary transporter [Cyclobacterium plantarum]